MQDSSKIPTFDSQNETGQDYTILSNFRHGHVIDNTYYPDGLEGSNRTAQSGDTGPGQVFAFAIMEVCSSCSAGRMPWHCNWLPASHLEIEPVSGREMRRKTGETLRRGTASTRPASPIRSKWPPKPGPPEWTTSTTVSLQTAEGPETLKGASPQTTGPHRPLLPAPMDCPCNEIHRLPPDRCWWCGWDPGITTQWTARLGSPRPKKMQKGVGTLVGGTEVLLPEWCCPCFSARTSPSIQGPGEGMQKEEEREKKRR